MRAHRHANTHDTLTHTHTSRVAAIVWHHASLRGARCGRALLLRPRRVRTTRAAAFASHGRLTRQPALLRRSVRATPCVPVCVCAHTRAVVAPSHALRGSLSSGTAGVCVCVGSWDWYCGHQCGSSPDGNTTGKPEARRCGVRCGSAHADAATGWRAADRVRGACHGSGHGCGRAVTPSGKKAGWYV